jgi:hypothetical protein
MHCTVRVYSGAPDLADALVANVDAVKQLIGGIDGFNGYYLVKTPDGAVSISVFESEAGTSESTRVAAGWIKDNLPDMDIAPPEVFAGEVVIGA